MFITNTSKCLLLVTTRRLIGHQIGQSGRFMSSTFPVPPVFKSGHSLDRLYPKSMADTTTLAADSQPKSITGGQRPAATDKFDGHIPTDKLQITYCRSSGPGGQHVNTTNTKVTVQCHLDSADWLPVATRDRLKDLHKNNINKDGFWIIRSDKTRTQLLNLADCMDKMRCYITEAARPPYTPSIETLEKIRENREKAAIRRLEQKKCRSMTKSSRRVVDD